MDHLVESLLVQNNQKDRHHNDNTDENEGIGCRIPHFGSSVWTVFVEWSVKPV